MLKPVVSLLSTACTNQSRLLPRSAPVAAEPAATSALAASESMGPLLGVAAVVEGVLGVGAAEASGGGRGGGGPEGCLAAGTAGAEGGTDRMGARPAMKAAGGGGTALSIAKSALLATSLGYDLEAQAPVIQARDETQMRLLGLPRAKSMTCEMLPLRPMLPIILSATRAP